MEPTEIAALRRVGLSDNEAKVYAALVSLGPSLASEISGECRLYRPNVYDALERLVRRGLATSIVKNNKKYFEAENPEKIRAMFEEAKKEVSLALPRLEGMYEKIGKPMEVRFFEGPEGIKAITEEMVRTLGRGDEWLALGATARLSVIVSRQYLMHALRQIAKKGASQRGVYADSPEIRKRVEPFKRIPRNYQRFIPKELVTDATFHICKGKTAIYDYSEKRPTAILVENAEIARTFTKYFEHFWGESKE